MRETMTLRRGLLAVGVVLAGLIAALALHTTPAHAGPLPPAQDPFYSYSGSLAGVANGTVLRTRHISFDASGLTVPVTSTQVVYRTTDEQGAPAIAVATVVEPLTGATNKIVSYQWAYDGLAANCEPSYAIRGGTPTEGTNADEQLLTVPLLLAGDTVVIPDYETEGNDFAAGRMEGQATLDGIKATEGLLGLGASTQTVLVGYSGGAIASDWAAELAPSYAPTLDIVGTAIGGIAVDLNHNLTYVNGSQEWSGAIPAALIGISRAFKLNLTPYLSSYGAKLLQTVGGTCLESDLGAYPGLTYQKLLKPQYTNIDQVAPVTDALNTLIMGTGGIPAGPLFMGVGDADGIGDDVMVDADDEALATKYCSDGLSVQFSLYKNEDHGDAGLNFLPQAIDWAITRLTVGALPAENGCGRIPAGDSLAPLALAPTPTAAAAAAARKADVHLQYRSHGARAVLVRLRAVRATVKGLTVELENASHTVLASRTVPDAGRDRLLSMTLTAHAQLKPGTYRVLARAAGTTLRTVSFRVTGRH